MPYEPLTLDSLAKFIRAANGDEDANWRYVAEFLEDAKWETAATRRELVWAEPQPTDSEQWDVFLAALAEHVTSHDHLSAPAWAQRRTLKSFWFPFNTAAARVDAFVHSPVSFRRRGIFVAPQELAVA